MTKYYLHSDGSASTSAPKSGLVADSKEFTAYVFDPSNPQQTHGGNNLWSDAPCGKYHILDLIKI
jgi:sarcosine oxidase delta subunit